MLQHCPACQHEMRLSVLQIIDEQVIQCPHCSHHYKIYMDPKAKQIMERSNQEVMAYMINHPHRDQELTHGLPSGVMNTFE